MSFNKIVQSFNKLTEEAQTMTFATRDLGLQKDARKKLLRFRNRIKKWKDKFAQARESDMANRFLSIELTNLSLIAELTMWIDLKENRPEKAWDSLIEAEEWASAAMRAHPCGYHLEHNLRKLHMIERIVFPPQTFVSVGAVVRNEECSICGEAYRDCEHIAGRAYMGELCSVICRGVEPREVSIVDDPADKRCRVTHFSEAGGRRNKMTWRLE